MAIFHISTKFISYFICISPICVDFPSTHPGNHSIILCNFVVICPVLLVDFSVSIPICPKGISCYPPSRFDIYSYNPYFSFCLFIFVLRHSPTRAPLPPPILKIIFASSHPVLPADSCTSRGASSAPGPQRRKAARAFSCPGRLLRRVTLSLMWWISPHSELIVPVVTFGAAEQVCCRHRYIGLYLHPNRSLRRIWIFPLHIRTLGL